MSECVSVAMTVRMCVCVCPRLRACRCACAHARVCARTRSLRANFAARRAPFAHARSPLLQPPPREKNWGAFIHTKCHQPSLNRGGEDTRHTPPNLPTA